MFTVRWKRSALDELTRLWMLADSTMRQAITAATNEIDQGLKQEPAGKGESRDGNDRVWFVFPLGIRFEVNHEKAIVRVLQVWVYQRRR
jgi:ADP-ribosylglycohydrolase